MALLYWKMLSYCLVWRRWEGVLSVWYCCVKEKGVLQRQSPKFEATVRHPGCSKTSAHSTPALLRRTVCRQAQVVEAGQ